MTEKEIGIYIHIPFCKRKCYYCDFISYCNQNENIDRYIEAIINEIELRKNEIIDREITTIYIGGGTPSYIEEKYIEKIVNKLKPKKSQEITIEINPGTATECKLRA